MLYGVVDAPGDEAALGRVLRGAGMIIGQLSETLARPASGTADIRRGYDGVVGAGDAKAWPRAVVICSCAAARMVV